MILKEECISLHMHLDNITTKTTSRSGGIYSITNLKTGRVYIGQTKDLYKRWISHKHLLLKNKHVNTYLQRSFNKHGVDNFDFVLIEICDQSIITEREQYYIDNVKLCYNQKCAKDHPNAGKTNPASDEARRKMSLAKKGVCPSNHKSMQKRRWKKLRYSINNIVLMSFDSAAEAARYFNMKPNIFHQYIAVTRKTEKFPKGYKFEYY